MSQCEEIVKSAISKRASVIERNNARLGMGRPFQDDRAQADRELASVLETAIAEFFASPEVEPTFPCSAISAPELSEWRCELFGTGPHGMILTPNKGNEPCWFWRCMQRLCFGNKWTKATKT
jgi:hypothetical protein